MGDACIGHASPASPSDIRAGAATPTVSVIICAYTLERWQHLCSSLESVWAQTLQPSQTLLVVDHNHQLLECARAHVAASGPAGTWVLENGGKRGLSGARNTGLAAATGEIVAFLDDDAFADRDWLKRLVAAYEDERVVAAGGRIVPAWQSPRPGWFPAEFDWVLGCTYQGMPEGRALVRNVIGANMSFRRRVLAECGGFPTALGRTADAPLGDEETEACIRARRTRPEASVLYEPSAVVSHWVPTSRATWAYFRARCYAEGLSKAALSSRLGQRDGLASERRHVLKTLPAGVLSSLGSFARGRDRDGLLRAGAIVAGLATTATGYVVGRMKSIPAPTPHDSRGGPISLVTSTRRPRVLVVTPRFPPFTGGVEHHVLQVAQRTDDAEVTVLTTDPTGALPAEEMVDGLRVIRARAWPRSRDYYFAPTLPRIIRTGGWDLVHVQSYHTAVAPMAMLAALSAHIPYVVTFHGGGHSSRLRTAVRRIQWWLLRPLLARAERLITVARFEVAFYSRVLRLPAERFVTIPNGSDLPAVDTTTGTETSAEAKLIISVGRLEEYKGHHRVIEAMPEVLRAEPDARLLVLGDGPYRPELERLIERLGLPERVTIASVPANDRPRMARVLSGSSLVVLMSSFETHPLAVIEAVALGRPALVADTSGLAELAGDGLARAIPLDSDTTAIAAEIVRDLRSPRQVPDVALPTWEQCAERVSGVYGETIMERQAGGEPRRAAPRLGRFVTAAALAAGGTLAVALADSAGRGGDAWAQPLFWVGLLLMFAPAFYTLLTGNLSRRTTIALVTLTGMALYLVTVFDSPSLFTGFDELLHYRTLDDIARTGRLFSANPLLPVSPSFPGLEIVTHALMSVTGASEFASGMIVIGAARLLTVLALFLLLERLGLPTKLAAVGTMLYMTAPSFLFFDAQFAYESLALPLAITCLYLLREGQLQLPPLRSRTNVAAALVGLAVVVTHHVTSYALVGSVLAWLVLSWFYGRAERRPGRGWVPLGIAGAAAAWFVVAARITASYLWPHIGGAFAEVVAIISGESASRKLFQSSVGQSSPALERIAGLAGVAAVMLLVLWGARLLLRQAKTGSLALLLGLSVLAYPAALALRFTTVGWAVGSRAMAFIYVGLAFVLALGVQAMQSGRRLRLGPVAITLVVVTCLVGGVVAGSTTRNRVPSPYAPGAGRTSIESESIGAATWARTTLGPGNRMVADSTNASLMGSYGRQHTLSAADDISISGLFLVAEFGDYQRSMIRDGAIHYAVVDRRIGGTIPLEGFFYESWERAVVDYGETIDPALIGRFDALPFADRVFDSGNVQLYDIGRLGR